MTDVITALSPADDSCVAARLEAARSLRVVRRCADVAELLSVAGVGVGDWAVVSSDLRGLDLGTVGRLRAAGLVVVGVYADGDEAAERRLRQLSVGLTMHAGATPDDVEAVVCRAAREPATASGPDATYAAGHAPTSGALAGGEPVAGVSGWLPAGAAPAEGESLSPADGAASRGSVMAVWAPSGPRAARRSR